MVSKHVKNYYETNEFCELHVTHLEPGTKVITIEAQINYLNSLAY